MAMWPPPNVNWPTSDAINTTASFSAVDWQSAHQGTISNTSNFNIYDLPDRLRGSGLEGTQRVVYLRIRDNISTNDPSYKDQVKHKMTQQIAESIFPDIKFTQVRDEHDETIKVIGRIYVLTEDQMKKLINMSR